VLPKCLVFLDRIQNATLVQAPSAQNKAPDGPTRPRPIHSAIPFQGSFGSRVFVGISEYYPDPSSNPQFFLIAYLALEFWAEKNPRPSRKSPSPTQLLPWAQSTTQTSRIIPVPDSPVHVPIQALQQRLRASGRWRELLFADQVGAWFALHTLCGCGG
jgi:hypothetical protein